MIELKIIVVALVVRWLLSRWARYLLRPAALELARSLPSKKAIDDMPNILVSLKIKTSIRRSGLEAQVAFLSMMTTLCRVTIIASFIVLIWRIVSW